MDDAKLLAARICRGDPVTDAEFDTWLPDFARGNSKRHWTPVRVAMRAAGWFAARGVETVLDVGSGVGKFCVAGALATKVSFVGIEQRGQLVEAAREVATCFGVGPRARFQHGDLSEVSAESFDGIYFYNPFEENVITESSLWIDKTVNLNLESFRRSVERAEALLKGARPGTYVVTYNGLGGRIPGNFRLCQARKAGKNMLRLWQKGELACAGNYWIELDDSTELVSAEAERSLACAEPNND